MTISRTILVYTHPGCPGGDRAIRFFQDQGIPMSIRDIAQNADAWAEFQRLGCVATPVIVIGDQKLAGFEEARVGTLLGLELDPSARRSHHE